jgi:hypothetical protein
MNEIQKTFLISEAGRKWIIEKITEKEKNGKLKIERSQWQEHHTPYDLCQKMIDKVVDNINQKKILVLFNIEFIEVLINVLGINKDNITFIADSDLENKIAEIIYKIKDVKIANNISQLKETIENMTLHFDLCFSNPPYGTQGQHFHLKILKKVINICDEIIYVHPANWLLTQKSNQTYLFTEIKEKIKNRTKRFDIFDPKTTFLTKQPGLCCITHIVKNSNEKIKVNNLGKEYEVDNINNISIFNEDWTLIKQFKENIENYLKNNKDIYFKWHQRVRNGKIKNKNKVFCQFSAYASPNYRIIDINRNYKINPNSITKGWVNFWFDHDYQMDNFIKYLDTKFVRFLYAINSSGISLYDGCLGIIPVMDFNREWTDEDLYNYFNVPQKIRDYITNFFS